MTSAVAPVVTNTLIVSGGTTSVAGGGVMRVYDSKEIVALIACPSPMGAELEEAPPTQAHISLIRISSSALDSL